MDDLIQYLSPHYQIVFPNARHRTLLERCRSLRRVRKLRGAEFVREATAHLFHHCNSTSRLGEMLKLLADAGDADFWRVFQATWSSCEDTGASQKQLVSMLKRRCSEPFAFQQFLDPQPSRWATSLKRRKSITLWRGAPLGRSLGCSFTTEMASALPFATRLPGMEFARPVLVKAKVTPDKILSVITNRGESEVLVDFHDLAEVRVIPLPGWDEVKQ